MDITIFKDIKQTSQPFYRNINLVLKRIQDGASKDIVKKIRAEKDKSNRNILKQKLPAICFSGKFTKRNDKSIKEHSGLICLDFDGYSSSRDMLEEKEKLSKDKYVYSVFISPSGNGLKALIKIPPIADNHVNYFLSLQKYLDSDYFDKTSKNISRVCYESYDPLIHVNIHSSIWDTIQEQEYVEVSRHTDIPTIPVTDENKIIEILVKWWNKKFPMNEGERNNNAYVLAAAFNDFGVYKSLAESTLNNYQTKSFTKSEIKRTIDSAYEKKHNFGTKYYEDEDKVNNIRIKLKRGVPKKEIRSQLEDTNIEIATIDNVLARLDEENANNQFWTKNDKGTIKIVHILFKLFLEDNGFFKFNPEGSKNYIFVKVTNNLIDHTSEQEIKDFILNYLLGIDDLSVYNYFAEHTRYFREDFLTLLNSIAVYFIEDTKDNAYLYYKNCAVKISNNDVKKIDYLDLGGYVWKDHVIDRVFTECSGDECDYQQFIKNICGEDDSRISSMRSTIGYLLHAWKNLSYSPAVILNDEVISDNPEGGTGKGLFMNALAHMKKLVFIDGKSFNFEKSFAYQTVSVDTQILCFDDVKKHFDFERLFSVVTEGMTLEKKNRDAIKIPFSKSPKVSITTNYAIKGSGNSFERRKWELELAQHYSKHNTPLKEFGKLMFGEWSDDEWCQFDNYMIECLQIYMNNGLIKSEFVNLRIRKLSAETCHEFLEWCGVISKVQHDKLKKAGRIYKSDLYQDFIEDNPDFAPKSKFTISRTKFYKWLVAYSHFKYQCKPLEDRDSIRGRWIQFRSKHDLETNGNLDMDF
tara:strand:+ start:801 stop:3218 length:2418 start_codon:yes stop_codon:yes gene_type:complete